MAIRAVINCGNGQVTYEEYTQEPYVEPVHVSEAQVLKDALISAGTLTEEQIDAAQPAPVQKVQV